MNAMVPVSSANVEAYRASTDAAGLCKEIVVASALSIQGRKYVRVEGWQAIAIAHGCTGSAREVEAVEGGVRAIGEVRRMSDGAVIAEAEGFVGEDEPTWFGGKVGNKTLAKRPDYAIRAMAQTRAISRACRSAFAHVVVMMNAGLSTTPAEEVPLDGFDAAPAEPRNVSPPRDAESAGAKACKIAIDLCAGDEAKLVKWEKDNKAGLDALDDDAFNEAKAYWVAAVKKARGKGSPNRERQAEDFGIGDDAIPAEFA